MAEDARSASNRMVASRYENYNAATSGFRNYWYPVMKASKLGKKPAKVRVCGEDIVLARDEAGTGQAHGLHDRCPHRGIPLSEGRYEFPSALSCPYHGWTYDLATGELVAALTDGPDSPICGKASVRVKRYPVEERCGLIWVFVGDMEDPPPVEADIPEQLLDPDTLVIALCRTRPGNWRYAMENAVDEGHAKYLHRHGPWYLFRQAPAWTTGVDMMPEGDGVWVRRVRGDVVYRDDYPGLGTWPRRPYPWESAKKRGPTGLMARLPAIAKVEQRHFTDYEMFVPVDEDRYILVLVAAVTGSSLRRLAFRLRYWAYVRWAYQGKLNAEDQWMIGLMQIPPEQLYRPDKSITGWRKWCENNARGGTTGEGTLTRSASHESS